MDFVNLICPNSKPVWDGNKFSECFSDIVLGFGANVLTVTVIVILGITKRRLPGRLMSNFSHKALYLIAMLAACISFWDVVLLLKKSHYGYSYGEWFFRSSQLSVWTTIILFLSCAHCDRIFSDRVLCFWWILKSILGIPHLLTTFSSSEVMSCAKESSVILLDIMFGISINVIWVKHTPSKRSSVDELLLSEDIDLEGADFRDYGDTQSFWDLMTFKYIASVMNHGLTKQLDFEDLLQLPADLNPSLCHSTMLTCWQSQQSNNCTEPSLFKAICGAYGWPYLRLGVLKVFNDCIGFAGPLLLNKLIRYLQQGSGNLDGYILALSLGLTSILKSFLDTQYTFHLSKLKLKLRSSIMTVIYRKCLFVSLAERTQFSEGEIQTFMSVDADRTVNLCNSFHDMWSLPLQIGVALYLLYTQVKFAFLSGIAITVLLIPVNKWIAELIASATQKMMKQKDERIRRTAELLAYIRTLKMYGWEIIFSTWLMETRSSEVKHLKTRKYLDAWCVFFWATTPTLFSLCTFGLLALMGHQLDAAMVFTCIALFNTLISPLNSFPWVINGLIDAFISTRRLSRFLSCFEHHSELEQTYASPSPLVSDDQSDFSSEEGGILIRDACCAWSSSDDKEPHLVLNHVTLDLPKGCLIAVIGEV